MLHQCKKCNEVFEPEMKHSLVYCENCRPYQPVFSDRNFDDEFNKAFGVIFGTKDVNNEQRNRNN